MIAPVPIITTLKVGIANYKEMKARALKAVRGEFRPSANGPNVWLKSTQSFAKALRVGNRELLQIIADRTPDLLDELARLTGRAKTRFLCTLKTMAGYGSFSWIKPSGVHRSP